MEKETCVEILENLDRKNVLTLEEAAQGFQLSLAICDYGSALKYQQNYLDLIYKLFLDIALNINKKEYIDKFIKNKKAWDYVISHALQLQTVYIAIMLRADTNNNKNILDFILDRQLSNYILKEVESLNFSKKSLSYAINYLNAEVEKEKKRIEIRALIYEAENSDDIKLALELYENDQVSEHDKNYLLLHIAKLIAKTSLDEALEIVSVLDQKKWDYSISNLKYNAACHIAKSDIQKASLIMENIESIEHKYAFKAYIASLDKNLKEIVNIINEIDGIKKKFGFNDDDYDHIILAVVYAIAESYPCVADRLITKSKEKWGEIFGLQEDIAVCIAKDDLNKALEYLNNIEEEFFQTSAIKKILLQIKDKEKLENILDNITKLKGKNFQYELLYTIHKDFKIDLYRKMYNVAIKIHPYHRLNIKIDKTCPN